MFDWLKDKLRGKNDESVSSVSDYSLMAVDIHSHLIPGIDDGAKTMDDSIYLLRRLEGMGFKKIITSPHVMADGYRNTREILLKGRDEVRLAIAQNGIHLQFDVTGEYHIDEGMYEMIEKQELLPFGKNYVLVELPFLAKPPIMGDITYKLQTSGYNVILAHPERYNYFHEHSFETYKSLKDRNLLFQINIVSLTGAYGGAVKYTAEKMVNERMVDFLGTDLHGLRHLELLQESLGTKYLERILHDDRLLNKTLL